MSGKSKKILYLFAVILFSYWIFKPMLINGFFPIHDDTQLARVYSLSQELKSGIFPVRLVGSLGYGYSYPLFNFYAPLPYYVGGLFYQLGFDLILATKLMFITGAVLSGIFMFLLASYISSPFYGIVASILYLYAPYHAVNMYVRGAVGEYYAYAFLPLLVLGLLILLNTKKKDKKDIKCIIPGALGFAGILLSHNIFGLISFYLLGIFYVIIMFLFIYKKISSKKIMSLIYMAVLGIGLAAFFIFPAFMENKYTSVNSLISGSNNYFDHFVSLSQLWDSPWGFAGSSKGFADGLSFKIGKFHIFSALISTGYLMYLLTKKNLNRIHLFSFLGFLSIGLFSIFMMLPISSFIYRFLPFLSFVQFPWRFLNFAVFSVSIIPVFLSLIANRLIRVSIAIFLAAGTIVINGKYFAPRYIASLTEKMYLDSDNFIFASSKISDEYLPPNLVPPKTKKDIRQITTDNELFRIIVLEDETVNKTFRLENNSPQEFQTDIAYFPGWTGVLDSRHIDLNTKDGWIYLDIPPGSHLLELKFGNTPIRNASNAISFLSFILLLYFALMPKKYLWPKNLRLK